MCKLVTITVDRKTWEKKAIKVEDSNETIDYEGLMDAVIDSYLRSTRKEGQPVLTNESFSLN